MIDCFILCWLISPTNSLTEALGQKLRPPAMSAVLTNANGIELLFYFLFFRNENFREQCRNCKKDPFDYQPPPTNKEPPENAVVRINGFYT